MEVYNLFLNFKGNKGTFMDLCFFDTKCFGDQPSYLTCKQVLIGCPFTSIKFNDAQLESNSNLKLDFRITMSSLHVCECQVLINGLWRWS